MDDDAAVRDSLLIMLTLADLSVETCQSGAELLLLLETHKPDCLVLDVHMPGMGGLEVLERLKALGYTIPVIMISGNMDDATRTSAHQAGVSRILKKPFSGAILVETIQELIA